MSPDTHFTVKNPSASKPLRQFSAVLYKKNYVGRLGAAKSKRKSIISGIMLWSSIPKSQEYTKINEWDKKSLYNCILQHNQVVHSPIKNNFIKVSPDGHSETQLLSKLFLQVSVR